jgi:hypothetical protein
VVSLLADGCSNDAGPSDCSAVDSLGISRCNRFRMLRDMSLNGLWRSSDPGDGVPARSWPIFRYLKRILLGGPWVGTDDIPWSVFPQSLHAVYLQ